MQAIRSGKSSKVKGEILNTGLPFSRLLDEVLALLVFTFFSDIEAFDWPMVTHHAGVHQAFGAFFLIQFKKGLGFKSCLHNWMDFGLSHSKGLRHIVNSIHALR